jgi:hypothetical protein
MGFVRQTKRVCRRMSSVAWQRGGARGKWVKDASQTRSVPASRASLSTGIRVSKAKDPGRICDRYWIFAQVCALIAETRRGSPCAANCASSSLWAGSRRGIGADLEDTQSHLLETLDPVLAGDTQPSGRGWASPLGQGAPDASALDECSHRRPSPASLSLYPPSRPFDHQSGPFAQTADSDPHLCAVG